MPTFQNGETNTAVRQKINDAITLIESFDQEGVYAAAASAAASSAAAGAASGRLDVGSFAELSTKFNYTGTGGRQLAAAGDIILWREKGFAYEVLASGASTFDLDYTGSGGVKLEAVPLMVGASGGIYVASMLGATGDGLTDDTAALNALIVKIYAKTANARIPAGSYRTTSTITIPGGTHGIRITGDGAGTVIEPEGCAAFNYAGSGYYRHVLENMWLKGNGSAVAAINQHPTTVTNVLGGAMFRGLRISNFESAWSLKNAQINVFEDCDVNISGGQVFDIVPDSGSGQQCNCNRVERLRVTGTGTVITLTLPTATERAGQWQFSKCDIQLSGTTIPFYIPDSFWSIEGCEFENSTAPNLIHLESTGATLSADSTIIRNNLFLGSTVAIRISQAVGAAQTPTRIYIDGNITVSGNFLDIEKGNDIFIGPHNGTVNNIGGRFVMQYGGRNNSGCFKAINENTANDAVGAKVGAITSTTVIGKNLAGQATFAGAATRSVTFAAGRSEPDTAYRVVVTGSVNETFWITAKATTGFTINSSNAASTAVVDWIIIR